MQEQKGHFSFVSLIFTLYLFTPNIESACVLASVDAGGKPSCDDAGTFYCGLHVWSSAWARTRWLMLLVNQQDVSPELSDSSWE